MILLGFLLLFLASEECIQHHKRKGKSFFESRLRPKECGIILEDRRQKFSKLIIALISTERIGKKIFDESPHLWISSQLKHVAYKRTKTVILNEVKNLMSIYYYILRFTQEDRDSGCSAQEDTTLLFS